MDGSTLFLHGCPGGPADARLLGDVTGLQAPDLLAAPDIRDAAVSLVTGARGAHVIGFSLGVLPALYLAQQARPAIARLTLVSAAAPLQLGDFLPDMAGRPVFKVARHWPAGLRGLIAMQGAMGRWRPAWLIARLFDDAAPSERALLQGPVLSQTIRDAIDNSYGRYPGATARWLRAYVADWRNLLADLPCPVELWHGSADTWAPPAMAHALACRLGPRATLRICPGLGHYGTLAAFGDHLQGAQNRPDSVCPLV